MKSLWRRIICALFVSALLVGCGPNKSVELPDQPVQPQSAKPATNKAPPIPKHKL